MYLPTYMAVSLWIFALFGFICLIIRVIMGYRWKGQAGKGQYSIIISARNQQETIEGLIRGFILKSGINGQEDALFNVVLVDGDSSDDTPEIMKRLAKEYCCVKFVNSEELPSYLKGFWYRGN
ncbi:MAG: glycosyltransferase [Caldicoprobacterales bacterium]|jgi:cellulose synthase/poly-beta-1,6-N-acetylglucosamine synthase-like glycosyltransferase|nr:glycosyltransferase [Clostridiales bacterium]